MVMRITNNMMVNNLMRNLYRNMNVLDETEEKLASGRTVQVPSDNPIAVTNTLRWRTNLTEVNEYLEKVREAGNWLNTADSALDSLTSILQRVRELTVYGANGSLAPTDRAAIAKEVDQLAEQVGQIANTTYGAKYIFGGTNTTAPPYDPTTYDLSTGTGWQGNDQEFRLEVAQGALLTVNSPGSVIFNGTGGTPRIFKVLKDLSDNLVSGDTAGLNQRLQEIDQNIDNVLNERAVVGAKLNRLELHQTRLEDLEKNYTELLAQSEDADLAEVIMNLKMQENVYRASLAAGARIIQPTLVDFLR